MLNAGWHLGQIKEESVDPKIQRQSKNEKLTPKRKQNPTSKKNRSDDTKRIQEKDVFEAMKERGFRTKNKNVQIIVYCYNKACNASVQLIKKLNKN